MRQEVPHGRPGRAGRLVEVEQAAFSAAISTVIAVNGLVTEAQS